MEKTEINEKEVFSHNRKKDDDYSWGSFLMFVGVVLLFNSLNILPWNVWEYIFRFWPVFIIIGGLSIIFEASKYFKWVLGILSLAIYALILVIVLNKYNNSVWNDSKFQLPEWLVKIERSFENQNNTDYKESNYTLSEQFIKHTNYDISIDIGASEFTFTDDKNVDRFALNSKYFEDWGKPILLLEENDELLTIDFSQENKEYFTFFIPTRAPEYEFILGSNLLITNFDIDLGAGTGEIDLDDTDIDTFNVNIGAGSLSAKLKNIQNESKYTIRVGAGESSFDIEDDVNYVLKYKIGLGSLTVNGEELSNIAGDGSYEFNKGRSNKTIYFDIEVGVGSFELNTNKFSSIDNDQR